MLFSKVFLFFKRVIPKKKQLTEEQKKKARKKAKRAAAKLAIFKGSLLWGALMFAWVAFWATWVAAYYVLVEDFRTRLEIFDEPDARQFVRRVYFSILAFLFVPGQIYFWSGWLESRVYLRNFIHHYFTKQLEQDPSWVVYGTKVLIFIAAHYFVFLQVVRCWQLLFICNFGVRTFPEDSKDLYSRVPGLRFGWFGSPINAFVHDYEVNRVTGRVIIEVDMIAWILEIATWFPTYCLLTYVWGYPYKVTLPSIVEYFWNLL